MDALSSDGSDTESDEEATERMHVDEVPSNQPPASTDGLHPVLAPPSTNVFGSLRSLFLSAQVAAEESDSLRQIQEEAAKSRCYSLQNIVPDVLSTVVRSSNRIPATDWIDKTPNEVAEDYCQHVSSGSLATLRQNLVAATNAIQRGEVMQQQHPVRVSSFNEQECFLVSSEPAVSRFRLHLHPSQDGEDQPRAQPFLQVINVSAAGMETFLLSYLGVTNRPLSAKGRIQAVRALFRNAMSALARGLVGASHPDMGIKEPAELMTSGSTLLQLAWVAWTLFLYYPAVAVAQTGSALPAELSPEERTRYEAAGEELLEYLGQAGAGRPRTNPPLGWLGLQPRTLGALKRGRLERDSYPYHYPS